MPVPFSYTDVANYTSPAPFAGMYNKTGPTAPAPSNEDIILGGVNLGQLPNYLFLFAEGGDDANWQGATKGFVGNVAVDGLTADERSSGTVPYAGTIYTNDNNLGQWQMIINDNLGQASASFNQNALITDLENDLLAAFSQINGLAATPGFASVSAQSLDGLDTTIPPYDTTSTFVINVTSGFTVSTTIDITGKEGDVFILRWDTDANFANGYQGQVKFQSGGAIVPHGGLTPASFIHVAGDINSSGGGSNPSSPYPQGPYQGGSLITGGSDWNGGGFFTGYWLTTGDPTIVGPGGLLIGPTQSLSNGIFVGGWYTLTTQFSMTSGTSGTAVPNLEILKEVSVDGGMTWQDADIPPGPFLPPGDEPQYRYTVTNIGGITLQNIVITDDVVGNIGVINTLLPGQFTRFIAAGV